MAVWVRISRLTTTALLLIVVAVFLTSTSADSPPKNPQNSSDNKDDPIHWHGLDYEYGMFDHSTDQGGKPAPEGAAKVNATHHYQPHHKPNKTSSSEEWSSYSDEYDDGWWGESYEDYGYYIGQNKFSFNVTKKDEQATPKTAPPPPAEKNPDNLEIMPRPVPDPIEKKTPSTTAATTPKPPQQKDDNNSEVWSDDPGDEDDGLGKPEEDKKIYNLPSDSDIDADKYLNPDKYQDLLNAHQIQDHINRIWTVQYPDTHLPCVMFRGDIRLVVPVNPTWFNRDHVEIDVPHDAEVGGSCNSLNNDYQELILKWNVSIPERNKVYQNSVYFGFATNWTSEFSDLKVPADKYALVAITAVYYNGEIGNGDDGLVSYSVSDLVEYMTPRNQSMSCYKDNQMLIIGSMQLTLSNMQIEAFRPNLEALTTGEFSRSVLCSTDEIYVFDAVMTYIIWFWIGALMVVLFIFTLLLALGFRRRRCQVAEGGFGYKVLQA